MTEPHIDDGPEVAGPASPRPASASAAVLRQLLEDPIGGGYGGRPPDDRTAGERLLAVVVIAILVAAAVWAAKDLRGVRFGTSSATDVLREQAREALTTQQALEEELAALQDEVRTLRSQLLDPADDDPLARARALGGAIGSEPVTGPGLTIVLDDQAAIRSDQHIQDFDLQVLVNALWASGAEAIAIDGQRLATQSSIRNAGEAILVNLTPLTSPYTVEAIGDPTDLQVRLARTRAAGHLAVLRDTYGVTVRIEATDVIKLPAAAGAAGLDYAVPLDEERDGGRT